MNVPNTKTQSKSISRALHHILSWKHRHRTSAHRLHGTIHSGTNVDSSEKQTKMI